MLGTWRENRNCWGVIENTSMPVSTEVESGFTYNNAMVERDGTFNPASEDEIIEIKNLLAEPESVKISMDGLLYYNNEYLEKCLGIGDVLGSAHQNNHLKSHPGTLQADTPLYCHDLANANFLDMLLQGVKEEDLHVSGGLSSASDDLILDTTHIARYPNLEYTCKGLLHSVNARVIDSSEAIDSSFGTINPVPESISDQDVLLLDKLTTHDLHQALKNISGLETTVEDRKWLITCISLGLENFIETENDPVFSEREISSTEREDMHLRCSNFSHGTNSAFESCSPGLSERVTDDAEALDLSAGTINPVPESASDQNVLLFDNMTTHELHQAFRSTLDLETIVDDRKWLISRISLGMQKFVESENCSGFFESGVSSTRHEGMHLGCNNDSYGTKSSLLGLRDNFEALDSSVGAINPMPESTSDQSVHLLDKLTTHELKPENDPGFSERVISSTESEDMSSICSNDSHGTNSSSRSSPGSSERVTDGAEALDLSAGTVNPVPESTSDQNVLLFDNMTTYELHQAFRNTFGFETTMNDRKWLIGRISLGMQKFVEVENCSGFLESGVSSTKHEGMHLRCNNDSYGTNSSLGSCSSGLSERVIDGAETFDLSAGTVPVPESTSDQNGHLLDKLTTQELHYAFRSTLGCETDVKDRKWLVNSILTGLQKNFVETENASGFLKRETSSSEHVDMHLRCGNESLETNSSVASAVDKPVYSSQTERSTSLDIYKTNYSKVNDTGSGLLSWGKAVKKRKRLHKTIRRPIEASELELRYCIEKLENHIASSKDKMNEVNNQNHLSGIVRMAPICEQETCGGSESQVACGPQKTERLAKQNTPVSVQEHDLGDNKNDKSLLDPEHSSVLESSHTEWQDNMSESDDCTQEVRTRKDWNRRKYHIAWTLSEVMQLVEGVSQQGVGRWSQIKKLLFPSSDHRTAVDLKDKWRNLLRASRGQLKNIKKVCMEQKGSQPIPESVLKRVSELAISYPYPRTFQSNQAPRRTSKLVNAALCSPSNRAATSTDSSLCFRGRTPCRKSSRKHSPK